MSDHFAWRDPCDGTDERMRTHANQNGQCEEKMGKIQMVGMLLAVIVIIACLWESVDGADSCQVGGTTACSEECKKQGCKKGECQGENGSQACKCTNELTIPIL
ncbi:unnamed protein product [Darwinula stevensoni]|uniref:Uncharacterized protein n=1 Tax=Darwinula stevensoni TaxID=69355 RepID=A0A7R9A1Q0_9CRUS|nr:unnamed protein product [Darwinula stevensoni]CAG0888181.1 unnamed protein product [Darwinula stevensoni]